MDYSKGKNAADEVVDCATCRHSSTWKGFPPSFMVCNNPSVLGRLGGPRSVRDIVRHPSGLCGPAGKLFEKPKRGEE